MKSSFQSHVCMEAYFCLSVKQNKKQMNMDTGRNHENVSQKHEIKNDKIISLKRKKNMRWKKQNQDKNRDYKKAD